VADQSLSSFHFVLTYGPVPLIALVTVLVMTPVCRRIALARHVVDRPDDWLKPHKRPIPYLGGVAIFLECFSD
jgi:UDP-GlcNAc:undecaprenyl-phosphate GlcNAc-1-phosphate transferase